MSLPISLIIPTRNCRSLVQRHLPSLMACLPLVEEVVAADAQSSDGTPELLRKELSHPRLRFVSNPPGLYETWNNGLRHCTAQYTYVATSGDAIEPDGLRHLLEVTEQFQADVTLSPPRFITEDEVVLPRKKWATHRYLDQQAISSPVVVPRSHVFISSAVGGMHGFMGSSASNLYRTEALQRFPFPTDYGHVGDTAWGLASSLRSRMVLTPQVCADFVMHEAARKATLTEIRGIENRLLALARRTLADALDGTVPPSEAARLQSWLETLAAMRRDCRRAYSLDRRVRRHDPFWVLKPAAWYSRRLKNVTRARQQQFWFKSLQEFNG